MAKKDFKNLSAQAVDKFFNTPDTQQAPNTHDTPSTQHTLNTQVTHNTPYAPDTPNTQNTPKRVQARPRINIAFEEESLSYLQLISRLDGMSITKYLNELIKKDSLQRIHDISKAKEILK
jgi:hypothetical protein